MGGVTLSLKKVRKKTRVITGHLLDITMCLSEDLFLFMFLIYYHVRPGQKTEIKNKILSNLSWLILMLIIVTILHYIYATCKTQ